MTTMQMPYDKLFFFQKQLGLTEECLRELDPYRAVFASRKADFARFFYDYFHQIDKTRILLEHVSKPGNLEKVWAHWFESLFGSKVEETFLARIWASGTRHVELNLDQRFVNLGYAMVRQFCRELVVQEVPADQMEGVSWAINRLIDLCLLVETHAYITATSKCDREVVRGIAHQVRNPVTVIGGNIMRLQKKLEEDNPVYKVYDAIILESKRLERLVTDIHTYTEIFQDDPSFTVSSLEVLITRALRKLRGRHSMERIVLENHLDPGFPNVHGDARAIETMFYYLLENSLEAVSPENPYIRISSEVPDSQPSFVQITIFNTGTPPHPEDLTNLLAPFHSSKTTGTGFGLPIARLVAQKNLGDLVLVPVPNQGTKCIITLPLPDPHSTP
jgi:signal transduction histidine kinase